MNCRKEVKLEEIKVSETISRDVIYRLLLNAEFVMPHENIVYREKNTVQKQFSSETVITK